MKRIAVLISAVIVALAAGCAAETAQQAGKGATMGAVGGAVAGAVSSLLWGGNVVEGAVKGGVTGAAAGAAVGAVSSSMAQDEAQEKAAKASQPDPKVAELRKRIGDRNYTSALMLAQCQHKNAISSAEETFKSTQDRDQRVYALMIEGVAAEESGDKALAASVYPRISQLDPARGSPDKLRADALEAVIKVQSARRQHGLAPTCG
jgi:hypothetical protein